MIKIITTNPLEVSMYESIYKPYRNGLMSFEEAIKAFDDLGKVQKFRMANDRVKWFMETYFKNRNIQSIIDHELLAKNLEECYAIDQIEEHEQWVRNEEEKYQNSFGE